MILERSYDAGAGVALSATHRIAVARSRVEAEPFIQAWEALAGAVAEANVFYAPWVLLPALEHLKAERKFALVFLLRSPGLTEQPGLVIDGCFPLFEPVSCALSPLSVARMVRHRYCFSVAPLLRRGYEDEVMRAFLRWLHEQRRRYPLLLLRDAPATGALADALRSGLHAEGRRFHEGAHWQRALMRLDEDAEGYLERALTAKDRKEYRRRYNRLAELGDLRTRALQVEGEDLPAWLARFVELEGKGWKGEMGSALGSHPASRRYFEEVAGAAYARGQLMMLELSLDGRPLAMLCDFLAPPGLFAFKIAFDEAYAKYSPGVLLILEYLRRRDALRARGVEWMDACAAPDNRLINRLWLERKPLCTFLVSSGAPLADAWVRLYPHAKRLKGWLARRSR